MSLRSLAVLVLCVAAGAFSPSSQAQRPLRVEDVRAPIVLVDLPGQAPTRTGVIIDPAGFVVLAPDGMVPGAPINVRLRDGRALPARLVGLDPAAHVALVKVEASDLPVPRIGDVEALKPGDAVVSMGYETPPVRGVLASNDRRLSVGAAFSYLESDLGNNDHPVFNRGGELVGLTRLYSTHDKRALSVPIGFVMSVQQRLREQGK